MTEYHGRFVYQNYAVVGNKGLHQGNGIYDKLVPWNLPVLTLTFEEQCVLTLMRNVLVFAGFEVTENKFTAMVATATHPNTTGILDAPNFCGKTLICLVAAFIRLLMRGEKVLPIAVFFLPEGSRPGQWENTFHKLQRAFHAAQNHKRVRLFFDGGPNACKPIETQTIPQDELWFVFFTRKGYQDARVLPSLVAGDPETPILKCVLSDKIDKGRLAHYQQHRKIGFVAFDEAHLLAKVSALAARADAAKVCDVMVLSSALMWHALTNCLPGYKPLKTCLEQMLGMHEASSMDDLRRMYVLTPELGKVLIAWNNERMESARIERFLCHLDVGGIDGDVLPSQSFPTIRAGEMLRAKITAVRPGIISQAEWQDHCMISLDGGWLAQRLADTDVDDELRRAAVVLEDEKTDESCWMCQEEFGSVVHVAFTVCCFQRNICVTCSAKWTRRSGQCSMCRQPAPCALPLTGVSGGAATARSPIAEILGSALKETPNSTEMMLRLMLARLRDYSHSTSSKIRACVLFPASSSSRLQKQFRDSGCWFQTLAACAQRESSYAQSREIVNAYTRQPHVAILGATSDLEKELVFASGQVSSDLDILVTFISQRQVEDGQFAFNHDTKRRLCNGQNNKTVCHITFRV